MIKIKIPHLDLPKILFIDYDSKASKISFSTTKFIGTNNESRKIEKFYEINELDLNKIENLLDDVNLFPIKVKNLKGREITLAIFNYMPYTLWKEVVSELCLIFCLYFTSLFQLLTKFFFEGPETLKTLF